MLYDISIDTKYVKLNADDEVNTFNKCCQRFDKLLSFRNKFYFVIIIRILSFVLFSFQIYKFAYYLIFLNSIKRNENNYYSFSSNCSCTGFVTINGTINEMYQSITVPSGPIFIYPYIISVRILGIIIVVFYDYLIYRHLPSLHCRTDYVFKGGYFYCISKFGVIMCSFIVLMMSINIQRSFRFQITYSDVIGSVWFYECLPSYVPIQNIYNMCNTTCSYPVDHVTFRNTVVDVSCVKVLYQDSLGYNTYLDIIQLKHLVYLLSITLNISSIHNILSYTLSLLISCFSYYLH